MKDFRNYKFIEVYCLAVVILMATAFGSMLFLSDAQAAGIEHLARGGVLDQIATESGLIENPAVAPSISGYIGKVVKPILGVTGSIFLVLVIVGGIMMMTSTGNEERVGKAKKVISAASVGLVLIIFGYLLTNFMLTNVGGVTGTGDDEPKWACTYVGGSANCPNLPSFSCIDVIEDDCVTPPYAGANFNPDKTCSTLCNP